METIEKKDSRRLYGKILKENNLEDLTEIPMCICRGGGVCSITREKYKVSIDEVRYDLKSTEYKYEKAA